MSDVASGLSIGKDIFQFFGFLNSVAGADVISAYFRFDSTRIYGSERIVVQLNTTEIPEVFWLNVEPIDDYVFVRFPINDSGCEEIIGTVVGEKFADPNYWRWVQKARSGTIVGGGSNPANSKVDFVIVGYRPKAIIDSMRSGS